ncbi:MAG TPA: YggT family protein [Pyrinomonadaceae bacterium]|nr:YggT family protein [Pyrinomonadaceae bacterium]
MLIIDRIVWFINSGFKIIIGVVIALMIVRLIVDAMDLNPFGWTSRTVRRLSDGFVIPVRGGLRGFGIDTKFAPLVVILIAILLWWFVLQLVGTVAATLVGIILSARTGSVFRIIGFIISGLISIYILFIVIRIIFSWGMLSYTNRVMRFLVNVTEPLLGPLRRMIPPLGWLDISPLVAILILWLFQQAVAGTLLSTPFRSF